MKSDTEFWLRVWAETRGRLERTDRDLGRSGNGASGGQNKPGRLRLTFVEDHAEALSLLKISRKEYRTPHLSQQHNDLNAMNAFWAFLLDDDAANEHDHVAGVIGARMDLIPENGLSEFWYNHYYRLRDTEFGGIIDRDRVPVAAKKIRGKVVYIGDYFQDPKSKIDHHAFMLSAFTFSELKWSPDFIYGFITQGHALLGQTYRLGFQHHSRAVHQWIEKPRKRKNSDLMVYNTREDVAEVADIFMMENSTSTVGEQNVVPLKTQTRKSRDP